MMDYEQNFPNGQRTNNNKQLLNKARDS